MFQEHWLFLWVCSFERRDTFPLNHGHWRASLEMRMHLENRCIDRFTVSLPISPPFFWFTSDRDSHVFNNGRRRRSSTSHARRNALSTLPSRSMSIFWVESAVMKNKSGCLSCAIEKNERGLHIKQSIQTWIGVSSTPPRRMVSLDLTGVNQRKPK